MVQTNRFSHFARHVLTFFINFAHGGFVMAGAMAIGLVTYQVVHFGIDGLDLRASSVSQDYPGRVEQGGAMGLIDVMYPTSADGASGLPLGMSRVSAAIAKRHRVSPLVVDALVQTAQREGRATGVDPMLILAVITVESGFNPYAESFLGAQGLMQIIPRFHMDKISADRGPAVLFDPAENIRVGALILRAFVRSAGDLESGLQLYGGAGSDPTMKYSRRVFQELDRLRQIAGESIPEERTAERETEAAGRS